MRCLILFLLAVIPAFAGTNQALVIVGTQITKAPDNSPLSKIAERNRTNGFAPTKNYILRTHSGEVYEVVSVDQVETDCIHIRYVIRGQIGGVYQKTIFYNELPDDMLKAYNFNIEAAEKYHRARLALEEIEQQKQEERNEAWRKRVLEQQNLEAAQASALAMQQQAVQLRRSADAAELSAKAAMIAATNPPPPPVNINAQQNNVLQIQQNNFGQ